MLTAEHLVRNVDFVDDDKGKYIGEGKNLIIEFVGPTGAGKTTNCKVFSEYLRKHNLHLCTFQDIKQHLYQLSFYERARMYRDTLIIHAPDILALFVLLARHGVYSFYSLYRYVKMCIFNTALHQFIKGQKLHAILLDQWIIQALWSATIFKKAAFNQLQDELKRFYFKSDYVLYFDVDEQTACQRIQSRPAGKSRLDKIDADSAIKAMRRYNPYLHRLFEKSDCPNKFIFSTKVSPEKNAEDFLHFLQYPVTERN